MLVERDLASLEFWARPQAERDVLFEKLRVAREPVFCPRPGGPGFYALTRYEQVAGAARNPKVFSSEPTSSSLVDPAPPIREFSGSMISMDDPRHARLRRIVSRSFTPRRVNKIADDVAALAAHIVDELVRRGPCDFTAHVATPMPLQIICSMMGVPESAYDDVVAATNAILTLGRGDLDSLGPDGEGRETVLTESFTYLHELMADLGRLRRERPSDDLVSALLHANVDGEALTERELGRFFSLLAVAGNETTRHALSHALVLFTAHPDQKSLLLSDLDRHLPGAVEEVLRYATPVTWMRRTLTRDHTLFEHTYRAGEKVVLYYNSANRDEDVFKDPHTFDITRAPNPHFGFGAPGPHFCLGSHLARHEMTTMLRELLTRLPGLHATAEPDREGGIITNGIKALPCAF
ncbi:cytochrome P450 [Actinomadura rubrisoli]|uniref:Cytochrome P450 n=1 Tax=Actinomadura rubrisoli TaxID=2530368 RepID=A0A4R5C7Z6_9ACTN|nr:cytochrome P450 [Actinomadura rubrisoli]TDD94253.1 cytochrome P450 [Actinomadura rubrisoli]